MITNEEGSGLPGLHLTSSETKRQASLLPSSSTLCTLTTPSLAPEATTTIFPPPWLTFLLASPVMPSSWTLSERRLDGWSLSWKSSSFPPSVPVTALISSSWPTGRRTSLVIGLYVYVEEIKLPEVRFQILKLQSCDPETAAGTHSVEGVSSSSPLASAAFEFNLN